MPYLVQHLISESARQRPDKEALRYKNTSLSYAELDAQVSALATGLLDLGLARGERVAVYAEKRVETVVGLFAAAAAGCAFVPINPLLKSEQVAYILGDCNVRVLITTTERLPLLAEVLGHCPDLRHVIVVGEPSTPGNVPGIALVSWDEATANSSGQRGHRTIDSDIAAIVYTSGSTGKPKGVVLSHRNIVAGAQSVAEYLELSEHERILAVLPLSFDYGLNQITTGLLTGSCAVLMNYLFPRDIVDLVTKERITGLAAVPPLWIQLAQLQWPESVHEHLRYITSSGGAMPTATLARLRRALPRTEPYMMYGLTEAFRSTYLPPEEVDRRPESMGRAIPNAEILVLREDGTPCAPNEPGELVHRGVLVSLGYWNDAQKTAERFKPLPSQDKALPIRELAVWSGDAVRQDEEGYFYFVSRRDEMIKTSGYRVSPTEIEEVLYGTRLVSEAAAFGVAHPVLGQAIAVIATPAEGVTLTPDRVKTECQKHLPAFMVPAHVEILAGSLPRNPNGKIDRKQLALERQHLFEGAQ
jgi:acyl-CoA ligase (AMP-forming) (exosortase A-associated)